MSPRRRRLVVLLAVLLGLPVLGAVLAYVWIDAVADRRWAAAEERIRRCSAAFPEGDSRRDPEQVTEASKENQIHFVAGIRMAAPRRERLRPACNLVAAGTRGASLDPVLEDAQDFLDRIHEGARRIAASPSDFPPRWHGDWDASTMRVILCCGVLHARRQRDRNAPLEAAESLLDQLHLGRFWAISGARENREYALIALSVVLEDLRSLVSSSELSREQLRHVERELEPVDAALQSALRDLEPVLARWGEYLRTPDVEEILVGAPYRWRYFLPTRLMKAEGFEFADHQVRLLLESESKGYLELRRLSLQADEESDQSRNPLVQRAGSLLSGLGWKIELDRKAQVRLLRLGAHYGATGEIPKLEDPYGTFLRHAETATGMRFWSVADDGVDDGGHAGDRKGWIGPQPGAAPKDMVIDVPRFK